MEAGPALGHPTCLLSPHRGFFGTFHLKEGPLAVLYLVIQNFSLSKMVAQPELHADIYPAVDPKNFVGSQKGNVALVIGNGFRSDPL
jgi:hypothetical protein